MSLKAQGTIEYVVIIAVVIVIGLISVGFLTSLLSMGGGVSSNPVIKDNLINIAGLAVPSAIVDGNGDGRLYIKNYSSDQIIITSLSGGGESNSVSSTLSRNASLTIDFNGLGCECVEGQDNVECDLEIEYENRYGLTKKVTLNLILDCEDDVVPIVETPQEESVPITTHVLNLADVFSGTDGNNNLYYGVHRHYNEVSEFDPTIVGMQFNGVNQWYGTGSWNSPILRSDQMCLWYDSTTWDSAFKFVMDTNGELIFEVGDLRRNTGAGSAITKMVIYQNDQTRWYYEYPTAEAGSGIDINTQYPVKVYEGDVFYVTVDGVSGSRGWFNSYFDYMRFTINSPVKEYLDYDVNSDHIIYNYSELFSDTQGENGIRYGTTNAAWDFSTNVSWTGSEWRGTYSYDTPVFNSGALHLKYGGSPYTTLEFTAPVSGTYVVDVPRLRRQVLYERDDTLTRIEINGGGTIHSLDFREFPTGYGVHYQSPEFTLSAGEKIFVRVLPVSGSEGWGYIFFGGIRFIVNPN